MSEYVFKLLQPPLEDSLLLGHSYETLFDRFEIIFALECANTLSTADRILWGPPGRFARKHRRGLRDSPFDELVEEAKQYGDNWPPLKAGFFNGSNARFLEVAAAYRLDMKNFPYR